jgi:hypothetical protein
LFEPLPNPVEVAPLVLLPKTFVVLAEVFPNTFDDPTAVFPKPLVVGATGFVSAPNENPLVAGFVWEAPFVFAFPLLNENMFAAGFDTGAPNGDGAEGAGAEDVADGAAGVGVNVNPPMGLVAAGLGAAGVRPNGEGAGGAVPEVGAAAVEAGAPKGEVVAAGALDGVANENGDGLLAAAGVGAVNGEEVVAVGALKGGGAGAAAGVEVVPALGAKLGKVEVLLGVGAGNNDGAGLDVLAAGAGAAENDLGA